MSGSRHALLPLLVGLLAACAHAPTPAKPRPKPTAGASRAKGADRDAALSAARERLEKLLAAVRKAEGKPVDLAALLRKYVGPVPKSVDLPQRGRVRLYQPDELSDVVFVRVVGPAFKHAPDKPDPPPDDDAVQLALSISARAKAPQLRFAVIEGSWIFFGEKRKVVRPEVARYVPVFRLDYACGEGGRCGLDRAAYGQMSEIYAVTGEGPRKIAGPFKSSYNRSVPGMTIEAQATALWFWSAKRRAASLLVASQKTETNYPCTGEPDNKSKACQAQVSCTLLVTPKALVTASSARELSKQDEAALLGEVPRLRKLVSGGSAKGEKACDKLWESVR